MIVKLAELLQSEGFGPYRDKEDERQRLKTGTTQETNQKDCLPLSTQGSSVTGELGPAGRKGYRCGIATDRISQLSESHLGLESAAKFLVGHTQGQLGTDWRTEQKFTWSHPTLLPEGRVPQAKVLPTSTAVTQPREKNKNSHYDTSKC